MTLEERLIAYVDGELDAGARAAFEAEMAKDPQLAVQVDSHRRLAARIGGVYAPVLDEPVPARLAAMATAANDLGANRARFGPPAWAAMAACLLVGVLAGRLAWPQPGPLVTRGDALVARGELARALSVQLAAEPGVVRVGLSFRTADGRYCRTFQSARERLAGLACRQGETWVAEVATAFQGGAAPDYRTAASETPPAVLATVDRLIAGAALDAAQERSARDQGWRR
jgi:anti-sigma-K factor RskA